jgi:quinol monooxygenase YgiN
MTWQDEAAFQRHIQSPWVQDFDQKQAATLLDEPYVVSRWRLLG